MGNTPISRPDEHHPEWIQPARVENESKGGHEESFSDQKERAKSAFVIAGFSTFLKRLFSSILAQGDTLIVSSERRHLLDDLIALRDLLLTLGQEDHSKDPLFILKFSELWASLRQDCEQIEHTDKKRALELLKIKLLIGKINLYPPSEDHPLGFYLGEFVGRGWLPFPFMDLLQQLHLEYQEKPASSQLHDWLFNLNDLVMGMQGAK